MHGGVLISHSYVYSVYQGESLKSFHVEKGICPNRKENELKFGGIERIHVVLNYCS